MANLKPNPESLLTACQKMQTSSAQTFYVGDSKIDSQAAQRANMPYAIMRYGYISAEDLANLTTDHIWDNLLEGLQGIIEV